MQVFLVLDYRSLLIHNFVFSFVSKKTILAFLPFEFIYIFALHLHLGYRRGGVGV